MRGNMALWWAVNGGATVACKMFTPNTTTEQSHKIEAVIPRY